MSRFAKLEFESPALSSQAEAGKTPPAQRDEAFHLREATAAVENGNFEEALRAYARVLEHNPHQPDPWTGQVRMLIELGEYREAKVWADKALEKFPQDSALLAAKAVALGRLGDFAAAMAYSDASFGERGDSPWLWTARADVLFARRESSADYCLERAVSMEPANWLLHWMISRIHFHYGRFVRALQSVQQAIALDASRLQLWLQAAMCQQRLGLMAEAAASGSHALLLDPSHRQARQLAASLETVSWSERLWWRLRHIFSR
jgi:tetratricopeptide (TPR) repeat protein